MSKEVTGAGSVINCSHCRLLVLSVVLRAHGVDYGGGTVVASYLQSTFPSRTSVMLAGSQAGISVLVPKPTVQRKHVLCLASHSLWFLEQVTWNPGPLRNKPLQGQISA